MHVEGKLLHGGKSEGKLLHGGKSEGKLLHGEMIPEEDE